MTHSELKAIFKKYHARTWSKRVLFDNPTGWACQKKLNKKTGKIHTQWIPYGIPPPLRGARKKAGGGGTDLISLGAGETWFFEIKTKNDPLRKNQKRFRDWAVANGFPYWVVCEDESQFVGFRLIPTPP